MNEEFSKLLSQKIFIPLSVREWTTADLPVSIRLCHTLQRLGYQKLGDLHGKSYKNIFTTKNCGRKSIIELRDFIAECASDEDRQKLTEFVVAKKEAVEKKQKSQTIYIPQETRGLPLSSFAFSTRLTNVLRNFDFRLLGDLHGFEYDNFKNLENCGSKTVSELKEFVGKIQKGDFQTEFATPKIILTPQELNLTRFVEFVDEFAEELCRPTSTFWVCVSARRAKIP